MNRNKILATLLVINICLLSSCVGNFSGDRNINRIKFITEKSSDKSHYELNNGKYCQNIINIQAVLPNNDPDSVNLDSLYNATVFNINHTLGGKKELFATYCQELKANYGSESTVTDINADDITYHTTTNVELSPVYNRNDIISIAKSVTVINNSDTASVNTHYYNINVATGVQITSADIVADENVEALQQLLVSNLLKQLQITSVDELADHGYFEPQNITVTNNFYYTTEGITWSYPTYQIACHNVGKTHILVTYKQLESINNNKE